ncbi:MAG: FAD-dependent oxidoreductase [Hyphomicrobiaceae bacterium]
MTLNRREFMGRIASSFAAVSSVGGAAFAQSGGVPKVGAAARVVIIGAGSGGATLATYLRRLAPEISVTVIERNAQLITGSFSNHVVGGFRSIEQVTHSYDALKTRGVTLVQNVAVDVDTTRKTVTLLDGAKIGYDRLVLAPGVDLKFEAIEGYSPAVAKSIAHAWRGGEQLLLLRMQLENMADGGTVVMTIPGVPFSGMTAAYERICVIAHYLKTRKPRSKLIVLDANRGFAMQEIFSAAFKSYYSGVLEFVGSTATANFDVVSVDPVGKLVMTRSGIGFKGAVVNIIPPQTAGGIAVRAGCVEADWCPVDVETFQSRKVKDVHVIGDCAVAFEMAKTAFAANNHAKLVAGHLAHALAGKESFPARLREGVWSFLAPDDFVKSGGFYVPGMKDGRSMLTGSGVYSSTVADDRAERRANVDEAAGWYAGMTADMLGSAG